MKRLIHTIIIFIFSGLSLSAQAGFPDISSFTLFKKLDAAKLEKGDILAERGNYRTFGRGLTVQFAYVIDKPVAEVSKGLAFWNPPLTAESNVLASQIFVQTADAKFDDLNFDHGDRSINSFLQEMLKARDRDPEMQLGKEDLEALKKGLEKLPAGARADSPEVKQFAQEFWSDLIKRKFTAYREKGLSALPGYQLGTVELSVSNELRGLLSESPEVYTRFKDLLDDSIILPAGRKPAPATSYYWQIIKADKTATCVIGVVSSRKLPNGNVQIVDSQIYVSNSYFATLTIYELFPLKINGKDTTFVWRADYVSAPLFQHLKGVQQFAAGALMIKSIRHSIEEFKKDIESDRKEAFKSR